MPLKITHPNSRKFIGLGWDSASSRQLVEALRRSEAWRQAIFDNSPEALFIAQADGRLMDVNNLAVQLTGYSKEALKMMNLRDLFKLRKLPSITRLQRQSLTQAPRFRKACLIKKDGTKIYIEFYHGSIKADRDDYIVLQVRDIREGKYVEKSMRESEKTLRYLNYKIMNAQEEERRRISRELHDEVGQGLTAIKLLLVSINKDLSPDLQHDCDAMLTFLDGFINNVRRLCRDLRPTLLETLGLSESLRHLLKEYSEMFHFTGTAEIDKIDNLCDHEVQINIYRIIQEALTNIGKYSQATKVFLRVKEKPNLMQIRIEDNGIGFDLKKVVDRKASPSSCMGLVSMRERACMSGGTLRVWSREGRGTKVSVTIPLKGKGRQLCLSVI